jgi:hypothetical protein
VSLCELLEIAKAGIKLSRFDPNDWARRHYVRSSAVQCAQNQPDVDKVIPMRRGDDYSHIYIQDKNAKKSERHLHTSIKRTHKDIQTENAKPWVVIVMDMGIDSSERASFNVAVDITDPRTRSAPPLTCWRIYAPGKTKDTYPFLAATAFPLENIFDELLTQEFQPPPHEVPLQPLRDKFKFGFSTYNRHMEWENQDDSMSEDESASEDE